MGDSRDAMTRPCDKNPSAHSTKDLPEDQAELRAQIRETRQNIHDTLSTLKGRVSPAVLKEEARRATMRKVEHMMETTRSTSERWSSAMVEKIVNNPVPASLIGLGLFWLLKSESERTIDRYPSPYEHDPYLDNLNPSDSLVDPATIDNLSSRVGDVADSLSQKAGEISESLQKKMGEVSGSLHHKVGQVTSQAKAQASQWTDQAQEYSSRVQSRLQMQSRQARGEFERLLEENPLAVGAMGLAVGVAVALSLPRTQRENDLLGQTRDQLMHRAQGAVADKVQELKAVAEESLQEMTQDSSQTFVKS